jgi:hypothetical protein
MRAGPCATLLWLAGCAAPTPGARTDGERADLAVAGPLADAAASDLAAAAGLDLGLARAADLAPRDAAEKDGPPPDLCCGTVPRTWSSPGPPPAIWNGYGTSLAVTLAADDPGATLYYTSDGTAPTLGSSSGPTPVANLVVSSTTELQYFGANPYGQETANVDDYPIDTGLQTGAGYITENLSLDGKGPVETVSAGQVVTAQITFRMWYQASCCSGGCPCGAQLVYGVDTTDQGCLATQAYAFANAPLQTKSFSLTAPSTPGVHEVRVGMIEDLTCSAAMSAHTLANRPTVTRIGVFIVR